MLSTKKLLYRIITKPVVTPNNIEFVQVNLGYSGTVAANTTCDLTAKDVSADIPAGKKMIFAIFRGTSHAGFMLWHFDFSVENKTVSYRVRNVTSSSASTTPTAYLVCVPNE